VELLNYALRSALTNTLQPSASGDLGFDGFRFPLAALLGGLGAFVLAQVFAHGLRLREDAEGTV
jgi:hypothetical protein